MHNASISSNTDEGMVEMDLLYYEAVEKDRAYLKDKEEEDAQC